MSETTPNPENANPAQNQMRLRGIYDLLPSREARFSGLLNPPGTQQEQGPDAIVDSLVISMITMKDKRDGFKDSILSEATELIDSTRKTTTTFLKDELKGEIKTGVDFGIKPNDPTLIGRVAGLTEDNPLSEGIFSYDPQVRMTIERAVRENRIAWLKRFSEKTDPYALAEKQKLEERIKEMEEEFLQIFKTPIG